MLDKIVWIVIANKIRIFIWKYKFIENYINTFKKSNTEWKYYLIIWPILNIFILSWFFPFVIICISNFIIINKIRS